MRFTHPQDISSLAPDLGVSEEFLEDLARAAPWLVDERAPGALRMSIRGSAYYLHRLARSRGSTESLPEAITRIRKEDRRARCWAPEADLYALHVYRAWLGREVYVREDEKHLVDLVAPLPK